MQCPNCGKQLPNGAAFCTGCGTALDGQTPKQTPAEKPRSRALPFALLGVLIGRASCRERV